MCLTRGRSSAPFSTRKMAYAALYWGGHTTAPRRRSWTSSSADFPCTDTTTGIGTFGSTTIGFGTFIRCRKRKWFYHPRGRSRTRATNLRFTRAKRTPCDGCPLEGHQRWRRCTGLAARMIQAAQSLRRVLVRAVSTIATCNQVERHTAPRWWSKSQRTMYCQWSACQSWWHRFCDNTARVA